jgi:hypothetical protein
MVEPAVTSVVSDAGLGFALQVIALELTCSTGELFCG